MTFLPNIFPLFGVPEQDPTLKDVWTPNNAEEAYDYIVDELPQKLLNDGEHEATNARLRFSITTPSGSVLVLVQNTETGDAEIAVTMPNVAPWGWSGPTIGRVIPHDVLERLFVDAEAIGEAEADAWDDDSEYGYADQNFVGVDTWEDPAEMARIVAREKLPADWLLVKVVNFTEMTLKSQIVWLEANCEGAFRRVNWRAGCSTKIAIAFENGDDAALYKMKWR